MNTRCIWGTRSLLTATAVLLANLHRKTALMISVSSNKGDYSQQQFGNLLDYDRTMITHDTRCPINENSLVYIGTEQYIVKAVAKSLNAVQYAIKQVQIDETDNG